MHSRAAYSCEEAVLNTIQDVLTEGIRVAPTSSKSIGASRSSLELSNYNLRIDNPRDRTYLNPAIGFDLSLAAARFVWMMSGSDRLDHISFYHPSVTAFSDDGLTIPGSSFGRRLINPRPGINQLHATLSLLRSDPNTRRAVMAIYQPDDCGRDSVDIPCAIALGYQIRGNALAATTVMRSNNAYGLLPYNLFEFGLLAEVIAAELDLDIEHLHHFAISMHIYERDLERSGAALAATTPRPHSEKILPRSPRPLAQIAQLLRLDADLRRSSSIVTGDAIPVWVERGKDVLHPFWNLLYCGLLKAHASATDDPLGAAVAQSFINSIINELDITTSAEGT